MAVGAYAYPGFLVAVPVFVICVVLAESFFAWRFHTTVKPILALLLGSFLGYLPVIWEATHNDRFMRRFEQKNELAGGANDLISVERLASGVQNYPKYFRFDLLFRSGESGLTESNFTRHSVVGSGLLPWVFILLIPLSLWGVAHIANTGLIRASLPMLFRSLAFPIPDLLTTAPDRPPYTFASAFGVLALPFIAALALESIYETFGRLRLSAVERKQYLGNTLSVIILILVIPTMVFVFSTYQLYPRNSSGFYGWQNGMDEVTYFYQDHRDQYSDMVIEWVMDRPETLIESYSEERELVETVERGLPEANSRPVPNTLYVISRGSYEGRYDPDVWIVQERVTNPDGSIAFYLVSDQPVPSNAD